MGLPTGYHSTEEVEVGDPWGSGLPECLAMPESFFFLVLGMEPRLSCVLG